MLTQLTYGSPSSHSTRYEKYLVNKLVPLPSHTVCRTLGEDIPVFTHSPPSPHLSLSQCCEIERPRVGDGDWLVAGVGAIVKGLTLTSHMVPGD